MSDADITIYGDGQQTRSFCFVSDMVGGLMRLAARAEPVTGAVNLGNPNELTIADLVDRVVQMIETRSTVVRLPLPVDDPQRRRPNIDLAERLLGWTPKIDLDEGLAKTIAYFRKDLVRPLPATSIRASVEGVTG